MNELHQAVLDAARGFSDFLRTTDRALRRSGQTVPSAADKEAVASAFWAMMAVITRYAKVYPEGDATDLPRQCRDIVGPWLFRSRYFNRSFSKPHGYAGDFRLIEWMYDLENDRCEDATQPAIVNCLDYVFSTVHSVRSVQERRHWFTDLLKGEYRRRSGRLRVLDVASGGSRYTRDFLGSLEDAGGITVTLIDQDPAAIAFCHHVGFRPWVSRLTTHCLPVTRVAKALPEGEFDVVISSGLFDYLDDAVAQPLLGHMRKLTAPGGVTVVANFHPDDPSRAVKDWLVDWPLIFRDARGLAALFPEPAAVATTHSANRALLYGTTKSN